MRFWLIGLMLLPFQTSPQPYYDFAKAGAGFYGAGREDPDPEGLKSVRIGVLGPEKDPDGSELRVGAQVAIDEANRQGGYRGRIPYEMAFRADDGFWGVVASRVVDLAYEDRVWTIIGGLDGQRTHIAELVVAKAWVPVVSPWASDSSVDYANVPWVFRCAPADSSQVDALVEYLKKRGLKNIVALTEIEREATPATNGWTRGWRRNGCLSRLTCSTLVSTLPRLCPGSRNSLPMRSWSGALHALRSR